MSYDELDSIVDEARERISLERESLAEFAHPEPPEPFDCAWQEVTCADCGRTYQCTPADDYYNSTTATDGCCFRCLLKPKRISQAVPVCERCLQPIDYGALCRGCDPDNEGLYEENVDRWSV